MWLPGCKVIRIKATEILIAKGDFYTGFSLYSHAFVDYP